jgi:hypothetical protein
MKLVHCDGRRLEVRDVGAIVYELQAQRGPIKLNGSYILDDSEARLCRELAKAQGERETIPQST